MARKHGDESESDLDRLISEHSGEEDVLDSLEEAWDEAEKQDEVEDDTQQPADDAEDAGEDDEAEDSGEDQKDDKSGEDDPMPEGWSEADREVWREIPKAARDRIRDRETQRQRDYQQKTEQVAPLRRVEERWGQYCRSLGLDVPTAVESLMNAENVLRNGTPQQKQQALNSLIQTYGVQVPGQNEGQEQQAAEDEYEDPEIARVRSELKQYVDQISGQVNSLTQAQQQELQRRQQAMVQQTQQQIEGFRNQTDENGNPAHPHFDDPQVQQVMTKLIQSGEASNLEEAYDRAVWANPTTRQRMLDAQQQKQRQQAEGQRRQKADKARRAASSIPPTPEQDGSGAEEKPIREMLEEMWPT